MKRRAFYQPQPLPHELPPDQELLPHVVVVLLPPENISKKLVDELVEPLVEVDVLVLVVVLGAVVVVVVVDVVPVLLPDVLVVVAVPVEPLLLSKQPCNDKVSKLAQIIFFIEISFVRCLYSAAE